MNIVTEFSKKDWLKQWSGHWSVLTCTYLSDQYTHQLKTVLGRNIKYSLIIQKSGYSACYYEQKDYNKFGLFLASQIKSSRQVKYWSQDLINKSKNIRRLIKKFRKFASQKKNYDQFVVAMYDYGVAHRMVKLAVDFLPEKLLKNNLSDLEHARLYAETVYEQVENHMRVFASEVSKKTRVSPELVLSCTREDVQKYWSTNKLPNLNLLKKRYASCALAYSDKHKKILSAKELAIIERGMNKLTVSSTQVNGTMAYKGVVKGIARIIFEPKKSTLKPGEILITGMTRPDYIPLIKKSSAFVTDAGGILSHAAITARELMKPCVVGTKIATKVFKDGDMVEVDANKGIVRKV